MMDVRPPITSFSPSLWTNTFGSSSLNDIDQVQEKYAADLEVLKEEARSMLITSSKNCSNHEKLVLIDLLERLGVAYHFKKEIEDQLQQMYEDDSVRSNELFATALQFRLFRQHRYRVSCEVFEKFKDTETNKFKETITTDAKGLLSLYEATQVRIHGECILDEAVEFTKQQLNRMLPNLESPLQGQVKRGLVLPLHRSIQRIENRIFIDIYEKDDAKNEMLLKLAKIDFNYLQNLYRKELSDLIGWFSDFDLKSKLPFTRDRQLECYMWGLGFHFEPQYSHARTSFGRCVQMITTIDDTYDNYATVPEAELFTETLERWDLSEIDCLPDCMKILYRYILSLHEQHELEAVTAEKGFAVPYAKETAKQLCRAYNKELKWLRGHKTFTHEEYLCNIFITSGLYVMYAAVIPGIKCISEEVVDWLVSEPPNQILRAAAKIARYLNDLGSHHREKKEGQAFTAIDGYMKEYCLSSIEEVKHKYLEEVENAWKELITEWVANTSMPKEVLEGFINYGRTAEIFYHKCADGVTDPEESLTSYVADLLLDPIII